MKQATATEEETSEYVRGEIGRRSAIHNKDVADLIRDERIAYYQKALDSSLAYDDLALHDERDLEKVRGPVYPTSHSSYPYSLPPQLSEGRVFLGCKHYNSPTYEPSFHCGRNLTRSRKSRPNNSVALGPTSQ